MRPRQQPLVRLNIQKQYQVIHVRPDRLDIVAVRAEDGGEGVEDEAGVVGGDLEGLGDGGWVDSVGLGVSLRGSEEEFLFEWG